MEENISITSNWNAHNNSSLIATQNKAMNLQLQTLHSDIMIKLANEEKSQVKLCEELNVPDLVFGD